MVIKSWKSRPFSWWCIFSKLKKQILFHLKFGIDINYSSVTKINKQFNNLEITFSFSSYLFPVLFFIFHLPGKINEKKIKFTFCQKLWILNCFFIFLNKHYHVKHTLWTQYNDNHILITFYSNLLLHSYLCNSEVVR